ncbi:MAG: ribonuclease Y [Candidatus Pacebacteria bacterium]|nr:ribonuclease Y [Candidatus Paceibacterota bacterium]
MSDYLIFIGGGALALAIGAILGYFARQNIARRQLGSVEEIIRKKQDRANKEAQKIILEARNKANQILEDIRREKELQESEIRNLEHQLDIKRKKINQNFEMLQQKEKELQVKTNRLRQFKEELETSRKSIQESLEKIATMTKEEAKEKIFSDIEKEYEQEIKERIAKLERDKEERFETKAREILATAIQKYGVPTIQDFTVIEVPIPNDEIKGRIIGKEGRNIKAFERMTGVELIVDDTPQVVFLSSFDPEKREIARIVLERLIKDSRIQPARIEEIAKKVKEEMPIIMEKIGQEAAFKIKIFDLDPKIHQLLGRLQFRASFGQNVLLHSIEVAILAESIAREIGADKKVAKKAGLLHDIGKAVDYEIEGSHTEIGARILEKYGVEKEVIDAVKSHHEEYPYTSVEGIIVQTADAISSARPGARNDASEDYLNRIEDLEKIALSFEGVQDAYAIEAGRELRVFVRSDEIDDLGAKRLAREIADAIEEELKYPGEIKVLVIREKRLIEYAR